MIILDSNIFIYLASGVLNRKVISDEDISHTSITKIECLGFSRIHANELLLLEALFGESYDLPLTGGIVKKAIQLRQARNMSLGDSIIAATALEHGYKLWTANIDDFAHIEDLHIHNPLQR
ncbi:MAG TPA: type II toxin-antitoxin system VapC family toxin [Candidatus Saccharimonadales bacterium]